MRRKSVARTGSKWSPCERGPVLFAHFSGLSGSMAGFSRDMWAHETNLDGGLPCASPTGYLRKLFANYEKQFITADASGAGRNVRRGKNFLVPAAGGRRTPHYFLRRFDRPQANGTFAGGKPSRDQ